MKSVMISIKPKWCELIANGEKTVEVRKTRPKIETPFKCYIYCTKPKMITKYVFRPEDYPEFMRPDKPVFCKEPDRRSPFCNVENGNSKVIGEFVCRLIEPIDTVINLKPTCLTIEEVNAYAKGKRIYAWHISDLVIYEKPKDIQDFMVFGKAQCDRSKCSFCDYSPVIGDCDIKDYMQPLFSPPRSWCYCEELEE